MMDEFRDRGFGFYACDDAYISIGSSCPHCRQA